MGQIAAIIEEQKKLLEERKPLSQKAREMSNAVKKLNDDIANAEVKILPFWLICRKNVLE